MSDRSPAPARNVGDGFMSFTPGQKAVTIVAVLALAVGGYSFATWAAEPAYGPLFNDLSGKDASAIVESLQGSGTPYELSNGGATIMVPQDQVYDLRLQLSGEGLPGEPATGYALLDQQGITTSDFMQHTNYQRALEGELSNTIKAIDGVQAAAVHLVMSRKDNLAGDRDQTTASVLVQSAAGNPLSHQQVRTITHLVASSVEGLDPTQVTVAGADGTILSTGGSAAAAVGADARTVAFQNRLNASLQNMLDSVVGPGHAVVTTTAELNFDQVETNTKTYTSDPAVAALAESISREAYNGDGPRTGGVLGPANNQVPNGANGTKQYENSRTVRNNAINEINQTRRTAPGAVKRLNVAVLLNSTTAGAADPAQVQRLIGVAAGVDLARGDSIAVAAMPFDTSAAEQAQQALTDSAAAAATAKRASLFKTTGLALLVLTLLFLAWRASHRAHKRNDLSPAGLAHIKVMQAALEQQRLAQLTASIPQAPAEPARAIDPRRQRAIERLIEEKPHEVAGFLRDWTASDSERPPA